jgi:ADP-ribosyl-[dinitrogen reductase] hydrolase
VNQAIAHLLHGGSRHQVVAAAIDGIDEPETVEAVMRAVSIDRAVVRSGGFVLETVTAAFWALLHHDSFEEAVVAAVSLGDDADTTGAVTGALAGAHYGAKAIPTRWLDLLQPREELTSLADKLIVLAGS